MATAPCRGALPAERSRAAFSASRRAVSCSPSRWPGRHDAEAPCGAGRRPPPARADRDQRLVLACEVALDMDCQECLHRTTPLGNWPSSVHATSGGLTGARSGRSSHPQASGRGYRHVSEGTRTSTFCTASSRGQPSSFAFYLRMRRFLPCALLTSRRVSSPLCQPIVNRHCAVATALEAGRRAGCVSRSASTARRSPGASAGAHGRADG